MTKVVTTLIANGAAVSGVVRIANYTKGFITLPAAWTAADLAFQMAATGGGTFGDVYSGGSLVEVSGPAADGWYEIPSSVFNGADYIKLVSESSGTPVNQGADRTMTITLKR